MSDDELLAALRVNAAAMRNRNFMHTAMLTEQAADRLAELCAALTEAHRVLHEVHGDPDYRPAIRAAQEVKG